MGRADQRLGSQIYNSQIIADKAKERQKNPIVREALSQRMKAQHRDPVLGPLISGRNKGKILGKNIKISQKATERLKDPLYRKNLSDKNKGKKHKEETIDKMCNSQQDYWNKRRQSGLPMNRPARDEPARRAAISKTMTELRAKQRKERELNALQYMDGQSFPEGAEIS